MHSVTGAPWPPHWLRWNVVAIATLSSSCEDTEHARSAQFNRAIVSFLIEGI
jgi:hypothetical protein